MLSKILKFVKKNKSDIILFVCVALISFLAFSFGYIIAKDQCRPNLEFQDIVNNNYENNQ